MADRSVLHIRTDEEEIQRVSINGVPYPLRATNDLTLTQFMLLERHAPRIAVLLITVESLSADESAELIHLLDVTCRIVLDAPAAVLDRLGDIHRVNIYRTFAELSTPRLQRARADLTARPFPGTKPSRASNASTAGTRRRGTRTSRSAGSART